MCLRSSSKRLKCESQGDGPSLRRFHSELFLGPEALVEGVGFA